MGVFRSVYRATVALRITRVLIGGGYVGPVIGVRCDTPARTALHGGVGPIQGGRTGKSRSAGGLRPGDNAARKIASFDPLLASEAS